MAHSQSTVVTDVTDLLGGQKILKRVATKQHDMKDALRDGLPVGALDAFVKTMGIPSALITKILGVAPRTLARRKHQQTLTAIESDRLYRLARVTFMAVQVVGSHEKAKQWLERPNRALGGETPLSLLDTDLGVRQVEAVLGRIEHGIFS